MRPGPAEPGIAATDRRLAPEVTDWRLYRVCGICRSVTGEACTALYGQVAGQRPTGGRTKLRVPHASRQRRRTR